ncbi:Kv channel-interacting protein 4 [Nymphon striatum]|nr:Kv channel-interacting protein 4 [Nymphon striatum]
MSINMATVTTPPPFVFSLDSGSARVEDVILDTVFSLASGTIDIWPLLKGIGESLNLTKQMQDLQYKIPVEEKTMHVVRYRPERLDNLCKTTKFSRKEIQLMYRGFKQECPTGMVDEDSFKEIFSQFFPQGDATQYAHYVYHAFKQPASGILNFEEFIKGLSSISRGSFQEKLRWVFDLYDTNHDGCITKQEMLDIVNAIYDMMGASSVPVVEDHSAQQHVEKIFQVWSNWKNTFSHLILQIDANKDGVVTVEEFMDWCQKLLQKTQNITISTCLLFITVEVLEVSMHVGHSAISDFHDIKKSHKPILTLFSPYRTNCIYA